MRAGIITFLHNENYGSILQAWALQRTLAELGVEAEHLDYCPDSSEKLRNLLGSGNSPKLILEGLRKRSVKASQAGAREKAAAFRDFLQGELRCSAVCRNRAELSAAAESYDLLISGSDQIWSPVWLNPAYYLDFSGEQRRIAYAPSFGVAKIDSDAKAKRIRRLLDAYDAVSVREQEGAEIIRALNGGEVPVMPDPVFLMSRDQWLRFAEKPDVTSPYLACYFIGENPAYWERVRAIAEEKKLKVLVIPVNEDAYGRGYDLASGLSPRAWIGVLAGAEHVVTDSFHGASFSALLGRACTVLRRYSDADPESKNSRIDNLYRELGITGTEPVTPRARIDEHLSAMRSRGREWLSQQVK